MAVRYSSRNLHVQAQEAEQAGEPDLAAKLYERAIRVDPMDDLSYNRLMVYYRRKKEYRKELQVIQAAIGAHLEHAQSEQTDWLKRNKKNARLARALVKSLGLVDKKGSPRLETEQLIKWRKRLSVVRKRIAQANKK